jgi:diguanylate cyclase (GGDEF)-like protein/PAS domain S-box-containing protein
MTRRNSSKKSLYLTLGTLIVSIVVLVMSLHSAYTYMYTKQMIMQEMRQNSLHSMQSLKKNIVGLIEAYAVNEYDRLVATEMEERNYFAIVVKDYNMGKVLGTEVYVSGKIRNAKGGIVDYDPQDDLSVSQLQNAFYSHAETITDSNGRELGTISIYITDEAMKNELFELIVDDIIDTFIFAILMIASLFIAIRRFILAPLSDIAARIGDSDKDGIPRTEIPPNPYREISLLTDTMNAMIGTIKRSRVTLQEQHHALQHERDRFQLAVDGTLDGLWDWDLQTDVVIHSTRFETMLGYEPGELPDTIECWTDLLHPDDAEAAHEKVRVYLESRGEEIYENTFRMHTKSGEWRWIRGRGKALFAEDGTPLRFVGFNTDITEEVKHQEALEHSAKHDMLTHLPNRFLFNELIQKAMYRCARNHRLLALLYIDLDGFKEINDSYGHDVGDVILVTVAQRMQQLIRQEDVIARLGGDEFVIAISDLSASDDVLPLLRRLLSDLEQPIYYGEGEIPTLHISASIGVTFYPVSGSVGPDALLRQADQAMYDAKASGKNQYRFFNIDADSSFKMHQQTIQEFRQALEQDELVLHYQPKVNIASDAVVGFEALLRWNHTEKGLLYPDSFLPLILHEKDVMLSLGEWVFENVFKQLSEWIEAGYDFTIGINVSAHEFREQHTYTLLKSLLERYPAVKPRHIELEILETSALEDTLQAKQMIEECQALGFKVALDDFGTGYSTLSYLKDLPVDTLKIDRSFVMDMLHDNASFSILEAAMGLAQAFRCDVVAEGVESIEHGVMLLQLGCNTVQGYAIAKPMPSESVPNWLASYRGKEQWKQTKMMRFKDRTILYATIEHRQWLHMLNEYIDDPDHYALPELDYTRCRFGEWLQDEAKTFYGENPVIDELAALHTSLHLQAAELAMLDSKEERHSTFVKIRTLHEQILSTLKQLVTNTQDS